MKKEYILCVLFDDYEAGDIFTQWPLHVTLVPWCHPADLQKFITDIEVVANRYMQINSVVGEQKTWGSNTVNVIERASELQSLHNELLEKVKLHGTLLVNAQYTGESYTPHVTHQQHEQRIPGEHIQLKAVYLVEKTQNERTKEIVAQFRLSAE